MKHWIALGLVFAAACNTTTDTDTEVDTTADTEADLDTQADTEADSECLETVSPEYDDGDCLTFTGAGDVCGDADGEVCTFLVGCGLSSNASQCSIDCTMATTIACIDDTTVQCLIDATCAGDCEAAEACEYPVF